MARKIRRQKQLAYARGLAPNAAPNPQYVGMAAMPASWVPTTIKLPQICGTKVCPPGWTCVVEESGANACIYSPPSAPPQGALVHALLTPAQMVHLRDRALRFQQTVGEAMGLGFGDIAEMNDGPEVIAELAATSLFGDDNNMATGDPSPEWEGQTMWAQAYYYVRDNLAAWLTTQNPSLVPVLSTAGQPVRTSVFGSRVLAKATAPASSYGTVKVKSCDPDTGWCEV